MIIALERYWADYGCVLMQPYHTEIAAGTMNPSTFLRCLGPKPWNVAYVEPSIRPLDGRYGENPFRFQHYFQYQVVLKPAPENVLDLYWASLEALGIDLKKHDMRLVEDDWEQPTLGAWGLGWEVWCDGMEITQWTYFQQLGGFDVELVPAEMTYGLERLAMFLQGKRTAFELEWAPGVTWGDVYLEAGRARAGRARSQLAVGAGRLVSATSACRGGAAGVGVKGPPETLRDRAAAGFAKKHGVAVDELELRDGFLGVTVPVREPREVLP